MPASSERIFLSPPDITGNELELVQEAFNSNWIAPVGPHLEAFEKEISEYTDIPYAVALSSGTAALHLALILAGVGPGDTVACSTFTFVATANPIRYCGAEPVFIDSEERSWNLDPELLGEFLEKANQENRLPKAVIVVDLYGQCADLESIQHYCGRYNIPLIEDAAEALGAQYRSRSAGSFGQTGIFSFNGNKIITTSGGGMLVTRDKTLADQARKLATQAREPALHYEHHDLGYNYRLSNVLAGIGRGQLARLEDKIARRKEIFETYQKAFAALPLSWMPETDFGPGSRSTRWLSCLVFDSRETRDPWKVCQAMNEHDIECRPLWKPLHRQPLFSECKRVGGKVSEDLYSRGLCLPSGSGMTRAQQERVIHRFVQAVG